MTDWSSHTLTTTPPLTLQGQTCMARLLNVHDGDTVTVAARCFAAGEVFRINVRIGGIDTPEITSRDPVLKTRACAAQCRLMELLTGIPATAHMPPGAKGRAKQVANLLNKDVYLVHVTFGDMDKYGRALATSISRTPDGPNVALTLIEEGHANPYDGGTKLTAFPSLTVSPIA